MYVEYARQVSQMVWAFVDFVHRQALPFSAQLIEKLSANFVPFRNLVNVAGPTLLTFIMEMILLYIGVQLVVTVVRIFSNTLYRLLRFVLSIVVIAAGVLLGLYLYFTSTTSGRQQQARGGVFINFWVEQAMAAASRLAPIWSPQGGAQHHRQPPPINFQYQPPGF
ncbi:hypothetical protein H4S08_002564 [Coemansia sp. RSA 1365]|nr:hypothetical protein H4S08_002564 [Coemansia sp. RSA 1365]